MGRLSLVLPVSWAAFAALTIASAASALADPPTAYEVLNLSETTPATSLKSPPVRKLVAGDLPIALERTTLKAVQTRFGGDLHRGGDAAGSVTWVCYARAIHTGVLVYWFMSNNEMGGGTHITQVAVQRLATLTDKRCALAPARLTGIDFDVPSIGAKLDAVQRHFGSVRLIDGNLNYESLTSRDSKAADATTGQSLLYHFANGVVDKISIEQITST